MLSVVYPLSGLLVGVLIGMTGVGGGALMTPLLIVLFGMSPESAVGTDLLYASATKSAGTTMHGLMRSVDWRMVGHLAMGSIPAAVMTLWSLWAIGPATSAVSALIKSVLGIVLFSTALSVFFRAAFLRRYRCRAPHLAAPRTTRLTIAVGAVLGILVSIASVGAGALGITALSLLYPRLPISRIVGSDIAHAVPLTLVAGMGHSLFGGLNWFLLCSLLIGSVPGILIGSYFANRAPEFLVRNLLAVVLVGVGLRLILTA